MTVKMDAERHTPIWMKILISIYLFVAISIFDCLGLLLVEFIMILES